MKFSFWEKVGGSVLLTAWLIYLGNMAGNALVAPKEPKFEPEPVAKAETTAAPEKEAPAVDAMSNAMDARITFVFMASPPTAKF